MLQGMLGLACLGLHLQGLNASKICDVCRWYSLSTPPGRSDQPSPCAAALAGAAWRLCWPRSHLPPALCSSTCSCTKLRHSSSQLTMSKQASSQCNEQLHRTALEGYSSIQHIKLILRIVP